MLEILILEINVISSIISAMIFGTVFIVSEFLLTVIVTIFNLEHNFIIDKLKIETCVYLMFFVVIIFMILLYTQSNKLMQKFILKSKEKYLKLGYATMTVVIALIKAVDKSADTIYKIFSIVAKPKDTYEKYTIPSYI